MGNQLRQLHNNARDIEANSIRDIKMKCVKSSEIGEIPFLEWGISLAQMQ